MGGQFERGSVDRWVVEFVNEGGGEVVVGVVAEFVVEPQSVTAGEDGAAHDEFGVLHLFVVVAGVAAAHRRSSEAEPVTDGAGGGAGVDAVVADVHVAEFVDLVGGDGAAVADVEGVHGSSLPSLVDRPAPLAATVVRGRRLRPRSGRVS